MRVFALFTCSLILATGMAAADAITQWTFDLPGSANAPSLYPNAQQPSGVVITGGKDAIRLDGDGKAVWQIQEESGILTPATIAPVVSPGGDPDVVYVCENGEAVCRDGNGKERWRRGLSKAGGGFKMVTVANVNAADGLESLVGFDDGWLYCLDARGNVLWRFTGDRFRVSPVAVGDATGDGAPDIVYGTDNGHIYCLDGQGHVQWRYFEEGPYGRSGPNLADVDGDGNVEVLITRSNVGIATCLMALDGKTGTFRWRTNDVMQGYVSNATVDLDGDGKFEILHGDKGNWVYCTQHDGSERWRIELGGRGVFWAPGVADLDGDGALDILVSMRGSDPADGACAFRLDAAGKIVERLKLGGGANVTPAIGDIDGDGQLEAVFVTEGPNQVKALTWNAAGRVAWASLRGDSQMSGALGLPATAPVQHALTPCGALTVQTPGLFFGENRWKAAWQNPVADAFIEVACAGNGLTSDIRIFDLPADAVEKEVVFDCQGGDSPAVSIRRMVNGASTPLDTVLVQPVLVPPGECQMPEVQAACERTFTLGAGAGADMRGLRGQLMILEAEQQHLLAAQGADIPAAATRLRAMANLVKSWADALQAAWHQNPKASFFVWPDENPWDTFEARAVAPPPDSPAISLTLYGDEAEDLVLNLANMTPDALELRCTFAPPGLGQTRPAAEPDLARHVALHRAVSIPTAAGGRVLDALPKLGPDRLITLPPGEVQQLWLVIDSHGIEAGKHALDLHLGALAPNPAFQVIPITIEVLPVRLPQGVYAKMNWTGIDAGQVSEQQFNDLLTHGTSVTYGPALPQIPVDANGALAGTIDWAHVDETLARVPDYWTVLYSGPPGCRWPEGAAPAEGSPAYEAGFATGVRVLAEHMNALGWGYNRWAFYPVDEPWNTGETLVPILKRFCERVKAADPKARNYTDPAGHVRVENLIPFKDLIDVWQPEMNLLKRDPKLLAWFQENAKTLWAYEASGPGKELLPLGYYRTYHWLSWRLGLDGAGYWCYRANDIWWPVQGGDWEAVYPAWDEVVPSRRWEACRDGVEDYEALWLLNQRIETARAAGQTERADAAKKVMDEAVMAMTNRSFVVDEITRQTRDYEIPFEALAVSRAKIREQLLALP